MKPVPSASFDRFRVVVLLGVGAFAAAQPGWACSSEQARHQYSQIFCRKFSRVDSAIPTAVVKGLHARTVKQVVDSHGTRWRATPRGLLELASAGKKHWAGKEGLPILNLTTLAVGPEGRIWMGNTQGAICFKSDEPPQNRWFYFWGKRYLADNAIESIVAEPARAWIRTRTGVSLIEFKPFDLEQKSELFIERLQQRHNRYGYVADGDLLRPGDVTSFRLVPSDNDGLWTALCVAAECYRYAVTHSPGALRNARASLAALVRLESITGIPGFPARAIIHKGDYREQGGEWHWTADGEWEWKGDTSSDELVGHFFAYYVAQELLPDESDRSAIRPVAARIASHLLDHGLNLSGPAGRVTRWGRYSPEYFQTPDGKVDQALNSLEILSHLRVAYHLTGEERFIQMYRRLISELGYLQNVARFATEVPGEINYSDEELAFLSFYPLMRLEDDPRLRRQYRQALEGLWRRTRNERNPLWNFVYAVGEGSTRDFDQQEALDTLERIPLDTIAWTVKNSHRVDLEVVRRRGRFGENQSRRAIPPNERRVMKWNGNPFELDGGQEGCSEDDGTFFLLPYWLGRYHGLIEP